MSGCLRCCAFVQFQPTGLRKNNVAHSSAPIRAKRNCIMLRITCCKQHSDWRK
jgi:hypothetical protein